MNITHSFVSAKADSSDATLINPSNWNAGHTIVDTSKIRSAWDYVFTQTPGGSLTAGITNTVTLAPVPVGINGTNTNHYLYISGGTGTAEAVLITGGTAVSGAASGTITFVPANAHSGAWTVAGASGGVQECIYDCWENAYACVTKGSCFNIDNTARTDVSVYAPIYFPPGWGSHYEFAGINFTLLLDASVYTHAFWIDSMDFCYISFYHCQAYWPGQNTGACIFLMKPVNPNGEISTAITSSTFRFGTVVPAQVNGIAGSLGIGIRISALAPASVIAGNTISIGEINGGAYGIYIDEPTATYGFNDNRILDFYIHTQATAGIQIGTTDALTYGNIFIGNFTDQSGVALKSYGKRDLFIINLSGGSGDGIIFESTSISNHVISSYIAIGGTDWTNTGVGNKFDRSGSVVGASPTVTASPYTYQNLSGRTQSVLVSGSLTAISVSVDGSAWIDTTTPPTNTFLTLVPDMYLKLTYAGAAPVFLTYA